MTLTKCVTCDEENNLKEVSYPNTDEIAFFCLECLENYGYEELEIKKSKIMSCELCVKERNDIKEVIVPNCEELDEGNIFCCPDCLDKCVREGILEFQSTAKYPNEIYYVYNMLSPLTLYTCYNKWVKFSPWKPRTPGPS